MKVIRAGWAGRTGFLALLLAAAAAGAVRSDAEEAGRAQVSAGAAPEVGAQTGAASGAAAVQAGVQTENTGVGINGGPNGVGNGELLPVILDARFGDGLDEVFCLALLLESPEVKLVGVVVTGEGSEQRARLVDRMLSAVGRREVVVAAGNGGEREADFPEAAYAHGAPARRHADAAVYLLSQLHAHPGRLTVLALGSIEEIATAAERDPALFRKVREVMVLGGGLEEKAAGGEKQTSEWRLTSGAASWRTLMAAGVKVELVSPSAAPVTLGEAEREAIFSRGRPLDDQLTLLYHQWRARGVGRAANPVLASAAAVAALVEPVSCPATSVGLEVGEKGTVRQLEGATRLDYCRRADSARVAALARGRMIERAASGKEAAGRSAPAAGK